jgi:hypothetical protein
MEEDPFDEQERFGFEDWCYCVITGLTLGFLLSNVFDTSTIKRLEGVPKSPNEVPNHKTQPNIENVRPQDGYH